MSMFTGFRPAPVIGYRKDGRPIRLAMGGAPDASLEILEELRGKDVTGLDPAKVPDELRGKTPDELEAFVRVLDAHLRSIHQDENGELREKTPAEQQAFAYGLKLRDIAVAKINEHRAIQEVFRNKPNAVKKALTDIQYNRDVDPYGDVRRMSAPEARDAALRVLDNRNATAHLASDQKDELDRQVRRNTDIARRILVTENDAYRSAWQKLVTDPQAVVKLDDEERQAVRAWDEYRAMSEGTTTAGGFGIPVNQAA
jgi:hypothetical protein